MGVMKWSDIKVGHTYVSARNPKRTRTVLEVNWDEWRNRFDILYRDETGKESLCIDESFCRWAS